MHELERPAYGAALLLSLVAACAPAYERTASPRLRGAEVRLAPPPGTRSAAEAPALDGSLGSYVAYATYASPALRAKFEEWRAATLAIASANRLPEPQLSYGLFLRSVETRVGPQRHRFGLRQTIPWPSALSSAANAAADDARAAERVFASESLGVEKRVADAYWQLWLVQRRRAIEREQRDLLEALSSAVRARVEIGKARLADLGQIDLGVSRIRDALASLDAEEEQARAALRAAIGAPPGTDMRVSEPAPSALVPGEAEEVLRAQALAHPSIEAYEWSAAARDERARKARAQGLPSFTLGLDYIETGPAAAEGVADSGKDPIVASLSISLPLWRGAYGKDAAKANAQASALRAQGRARRDLADAAFTQSLSAVRDSARRIALYENTLIPQAETVYRAVTGDYQTANASLANVLLAHREVLDLRLGLARARAEHAIAWAGLQQLVGRKVNPKEMK